MTAHQPLADEGLGTRARGAVVDFRGVHKRYGSFAALHPTDLSVRSGEFLAIIGPSGSGKSTLLGIIAGFADPSGGSVTVDGEEVLALPPYARHFGMVFQSYALFPHLSVAENIAFPLRMRGYSRSDTRERTQAALAMVRLERFAGRKPSELSGGQQQRVALARAAVYEPPLLLMDEPLGALDKNLREEMQDEIKGLQAKLGCTVIYVTHDQHEAAYMADRLAVMRDGRIEQLGTPRDVYESPVSIFVAGFLGEASLLPVRTMDAVQADGFAYATMPEGLRFRVAGGTIGPDHAALCLRPENLRLGIDAQGCDNRFTGRVQEATFATGTVRYRIAIDGCPVPLTVRTPSTPSLDMLRPGTPIDIGWDCAMAALVKA